MFVSIVSFILKCRLYHSLFGRVEVRKRKICEKEVEKRPIISLVWEEEKLEREIKKKKGNSHLLYFSSIIKRKSKETNYDRKETILPIIL